MTPCRLAPVPVSTTAFTCAVAAHALEY